MFFQMQHFCLLDLSKEILCSIWYLGNVRSNRVVRVNHDNVASRGAVGRTHTIVDCRHEIVEKIMERTISGVSYMCWMDFHNAILCCGFLCARLISFLFVACLYYGYHAKGYDAPSIPHGLPRLYHHCTAIKTVYISRLPRQGLPRPILATTGYHACVYIPVTTPELSRFTIPRTSGYHTRHSSSYFICLLYTSPSPRDLSTSRMPSSA